MGEDFSIFASPVVEVGGLVFDHVGICSGCWHDVWMKTRAFPYKDGPKLGGQLAHQTFQFQMATRGRDHGMKPAR